MNIRAKKLKFYMVCRKNTINNLRKFKYNIK